MGDVSRPSSLDADALGFMCGLEIHQQLATGKLHSRMPSQLYEFGIEDIPEHWRISERRLRASQGESGEIDVSKDSNREEIGHSFMSNPQMLDSLSWTRLHHYPMILRP